MTAVSIDSRAVAASLGLRAPQRRRRWPSYQAVVLKGMAKLWQASHRHVLDVGAGSGTMAQCVYEQMPVRQVTAVDVVDRFHADLDVATRTFDGRRLPFADAAFDAATLSDVVAHVPRGDRVTLLREIARTTAGPLYLKDWEVRTLPDRLRLAVLGGSVRVQALTMDEWRALAAASGWRIAAKARARYRRGVMAWAFPNRLELSMRWER
ncbi:class I SAM-dependent methyltransferase [Sphingomonas sp.]|uniref:class I SAM-dependent methyltransferase n=1 Tax=Sphingomonas sp. TaxID=28214 RepID=UPI0035BBDD73